MSKKTSMKSINHGMLIDDVNIAGLINMQSSTIVKNEKATLNMKMGEPKEPAKKMVYGGRKRII